MKWWLALVAAGLLLAVLGLTNVLSGRTSAVLSLVLLAAYSTVAVALMGLFNARFVILTVLLVGLPSAAMSLAPARGTAEFYSASTQIIPVLLLVLALEARIFQLGTPPTPYRPFTDEESSQHLVTAMVATVTLVLLVTGELQALSTLASGRHRTATASTVYAAIVVGLVVVAFLAVFGPPERARRPSDDREP